jgi:hypothetical protein
MSKVDPAKIIKSQVHQKVQLALEACTDHIFVEPYGRDLVTKLDDKEVSLPAIEDTGQGARQRRDRVADMGQAPAGATATQRVAERARAAREAGDLPFDDGIGF